jgi:hypothetical protein
MREARKTLPVRQGRPLADATKDSPMTLQLQPRNLTLLATFVLLSGLVGCAGFGEKPEPRLNAEITPPLEGAAQMPAVQPDKYSVEIRSASGKAEALAQTLTGHICVQEALEQSGAMKKFKRFELELYRPLPGGRWHRMALEFDRNSHRVPAENDYALSAGDRLIVIEDTSDIFDDIAQKVLAPLGLESNSPKQKIAQKYRIGD